MPTRFMWVQKLPWSIAELLGNEVFQLAPLGEIRKEMIKVEGALMKSIQLEKDGRVEALIWRPDRWDNNKKYTLASSMNSFYDVYSHGHMSYSDGSWICMTREKIFRSIGYDRDHYILGAYVHLLERLDDYGRYLPPDPQGVIPEEDEILLGSLNNIYR